MLPQFPEFKKITLGDQEIFNRYTSRFPIYSDYNFLSIWSNNIKDDVLISLLNNNLIVKFRDYLTDAPFYTFIGNKHVKETVREIMLLNRSENLPLSLKLIPESNILKIKEDLEADYLVLEDKNNFDYILSIIEMVNLRGGKYHTQKNFVNRFQKNYQNCLVTFLDLKQMEVKNQIIELFSTWEKNKGHKKEDTVHEFNAIKRMLSDASHFNLTTIGIYDQQRLIGFMTAELTKNKYALVHFAKADTNFSGIYYALYHLLAKKLNDLGFEFLNIEQDLGIEGLRKSKKQWNPIDYLKKYIITQRKA